MRIAWLTDIHLNFLMKHDRLAFYATIKADAVAISGDIAESDSLIDILKEMYAHLNIPIFFVCGNHDYYGNSIANIRETLCLTSLYGVIWLGNGGVMHLGNNTALVGVDGWADMRHGNPNTYVQMNDENYINELREARILARLPGSRAKRQELADKDAATLIVSIMRAALQGCKTIIIMTHIPPYPEASKHRGRQSDPYFLPYYSCKAVGDVLDEAAANYPDIKFRVFCGHTHGKAYYKRAPNLIVRAGESEYYHPTIQRNIKC